METALERALSVQMMDKGSKAQVQEAVGRRRPGAGGGAGTDVFLVLDGVLRVEKDGERLAEYGPGAVLGERAGIEGGTRTSTLVAVTDSRVAVVAAQHHGPRAAA